MWVPAGVLHHITETSKSILTAVAGARYSFPKSTDSIRVVCAVSNCELPEAQTLGALLWNLQQTRQQVCFVTLLSLAGMRSLEVRQGSPAVHGAGPQALQPVTHCSQ